MLTIKFEGITVTLTVSGDGDTGSGGGNGNTGPGGGNGNTGPGGGNGNTGPGGGGRRASVLVLGPIVISASGSRIRPPASEGVGKRASLGDSFKDTVRAKADQSKESKPQDKGSGNGDTSPGGGNGNTGPGGGGPGGVIVIGPIVLSDSAVTRVAEATPALDSSKEKKKPAETR